MLGSRFQRPAKIISVILEIRDFRLSQGLKELPWLTLQFTLTKDTEIKAFR